ncbi:MAG: iron ABC transporter permease [Planctomycetes bacterium]|nr:iron ABC transporter permease [Planctomycetota bacterium]
MNAWRAAYCLGLLGFVVLPLAMPIGEMFDSAVWDWTPADAERLVFLATNTFLLVAGTLALSLPAGSALAVLLFRTSFPGRAAAILGLIVALFVPVPIIASSWQAMLGPTGLFPVDSWRSADGRLWTSGMPAAIWLHALAAIPWVAFLVGIGLAWIEPEAEDEAALIVSPWRVLFLITLPRARASVLAAALLVILQTAGEASIAELTLVATLAEEMRTQFALNNAALGRTMALALPALALTWIAVMLTLSYLEKALPPLVAPARMLRPLAFGPDGMRTLMAVSGLGLVLLPLLSLIWKLGLTGHPGHWDGATAWNFFQVETRLLGGNLVSSVVTSFATGLAVALIALVGCWLARERSWFRWMLFGVIAWIWVLPGPVVGMALHKLFFLLPGGPWKQLLWYGPSPVPLMWAHALRGLPIAIVFLWPVVRLIPRELIDTARLGGACAWSEFLHVIAPTCWRAALVVALGCAAIGLGEVGASARVETPGWETFAKGLFDRMHYGVDNNVSALCLMMLAAIVGVVIVCAGAFLALGLASRWATPSAK